MEHGPSGPIPDNANDSSSANPPPANKQAVDMIGWSGIFHSCIQKYVFKTFSRAGERPGTQSNIKVLADNLSCTCLLQWLPV